MALKQDPCWRGRKLAIGRGDLLLHGKQRGLKLHFNVPAGRWVAILLHHVGPAIKLLCSLKGFRKHLYLLDAIQAKYTGVLTQAAIPNQIPVPFPSHYAIRLDLAVGKLVVTGTIINGDSLLLPNCFAECDHQREIGSCFLLSRKEEEMRRHGFQTVPCM